MCGRTTLIAAEGDIARWLGVGVPGWEPRYNLCPGQDLLTVRLGPHGALEALPMRWGLVPPWATSPKIGNQCINARAETVDSKPAFREAFQSRRCLIVADGWYEWMTAPSRRRQPYAVRMPDGAPFAFAGLWERWYAAQSDEPLLTCTIVTTVTCKATAHLHHRMPVVLSREHFGAWVDPLTPVTQVQALLRRYDGPLDIFPVSPMINAGKVDEAQCLERVTDEAEPTLWH